MPILNYVPPKKLIVDNRNADGGYYTAECDVCNTTFYPKRSNAKYCTPNCAVVAHRMSMAAGGIVKKKEKKIVKDKIGIRPNTTICKGLWQVIKYLKDEGIATRGIATRCKGMPNDMYVDWNGYRITRISAVTYQVRKVG